MAGLKVFHDTTAHTLPVWFDDPEKEYVAKETGDEVIVMKDREGHVIGFERLNVRLDARERLPIEATLVYGQSSHRS